jgi:hypothetical protein
MAYNFINGALGRWYTIPFEQVSSEYPPLIIDISDFLTKAIADALAAKKRSIKIKDVSGTGAVDPIKWLEQICKNEIILYDEDGNEISRKAGVAAWTNMSPVLRIFDRDHEFSHELSSTDADALADEREAHET